MAIFTIPKKITQGETLVVVSKKDWENLQKITKMKISKLELEKGLREALQEVKKGKIIGPFNGTEDLIKSLERK